MKLSRDFTFFRLKQNHLIQICLMSEEKVNEIWMCNLSISSGGSSDSDDGSKEMNDEMPKETLMKMVECTTEHIVWDVNTGSPIEIKYPMSKKVWTFFLNYSVGKKHYHLKCLTQNYTRYKYKLQWKSNWNIALIYLWSVIFVCEKYSVNITIPEKIDFKN